MSRSKRTDLPAGIGKDPDAVVALREGVTRQAIYYLRRVNGIAPSRPPWRRARWFRERGLDPDSLAPGEPWNGSF